MVKNIGRLSRGAAGEPRAGVGTPLGSTAAGDSKVSQPHHSDPGVDNHLCRQISKSCNPPCTLELIFSNPFLFASNGWF